MIPDIQILGVVARNPSSYGRIPQDISRFPNLDEALRSHQPDLICFATDPLEQEKFLLSPSSWGCDLFLEKPLVAHSQNIPVIEQNLGRYKNVALDFEFFEFPGWKKLKDSMSGLSTGHLSIQWRFQSYSHRTQEKSWKLSPNLGGGGLNHFGSHMLYNLSVLLGPLQELKCEIADTATESVFRLNGSSQSGITFDFSLNCNDPSEKLYSVKFDSTQKKVLLHCPDVSRLDVTTWSEGSSCEWISPQFENSVDYRAFYVKSLLEKFLSHQPVPNLTDGLQVQKLIEKCRHSNLIKKSVLV